MGRMKEKAIAGAEANAIDNAELAIHLACRLADLQTTVNFLQDELNQLRGDVPEADRQWWAENCNSN